MITRCRAQLNQRHPSVRCVGCRGPRCECCGGKGVHELLRVLNKRREVTGYARATINSIAMRRPPL